MTKLLEEIQITRVLDGGYAYAVISETGELIFVSGHIVEEGDLIAGDEIKVAITDAPDPGRPYRRAYALAVTSTPSLGMTEVEKLRRELAVVTAQRDEARASARRVTKREPIKGHIADRHNLFLIFDPTAGNTRGVVDAERSAAGLGTTVHAIIKTKGWSRGTVESKVSNSVRRMGRQTIVSVEEWLAENPEPGEQGELDV